MMIRKLGRAGVTIAAIMAAGTLCYGAATACRKCAATTTCQPDHGVNPPTPTETSNCVACVMAACGAACGLDTSVTGAGYCGAYSISYPIAPAPGWWLF